VHLKAYKYLKSCVRSFTIIGGFQGNFFARANLMHFMSRRSQSNFSNYALSMLMHSILSVKLFSSSEIVILNGKAHNGINLIFDHYFFFFVQTE
jgi:hypothetical protein